MIVFIDSQDSDVWYKQIQVKLNNNQRKYYRYLMELIVVFVRASWSSVPLRMSWRSQHLLNAFIIDVILRRLLLIDANLLFVSTGDEETNFENNGMYWNF